MLRLEKSSKDNGLTIRWRNPERVLNSLFWRALFIALLIHLGAFLIFHIQSFKTDSSFMFPPINVEADQTPFLIAQTSLLNEQEQEELEVITLPYDLSFPYSIPTHLQKNFDDEWSFLNSSNHHFDAIEKRILSIRHLSTSIPLFYYPLQMHIAGELTQIPLLQGDFEALQTSLRKEGPLKQIFIHYQVQVDEQSGEIFWYEKQQTNDSSKWDGEKEIEKILLSLQFEPSTDLQLLLGEVHFAITIPNQIKSGFHD